MIRDIRLIIFLFYRRFDLTGSSFHCCEYNKSDLLPEF